MTINFIKLVNCANMLNQMIHRDTYLYVSPNIKHMIAFNVIAMMSGIGKNKLTDSYMFLILTFK